MIEALINSKGNGSVISSLGSTIFLLSDFATIADIKDKGPLSVPVTKGSTLTVGSNTNGTYINFPGTDWNSVLNFANNALLNCNEVEVNLKVSDVATTGGRYGASIIDTRPTQTNGNYFNFAVVTTGGDRNASLAINNTVLSSSQVYAAALLLNIKIRLLKDRSQVYINDVLVIDSTTLKMANMNSQVWGIGRSAFQSISGVMPLIAKVYFFEIRKIS